MDMKSLSSLLTLPSLEVLRAPISRSSSAADMPVCNGGRNISRKQEGECENIIRKRKKKQQQSSLPVTRQESNQHEEESRKLRKFSCHQRTLESTSRKQKLKNKRRQKKKKTSAGPSLQASGTNSLLQREQL